MTLKCCIFKLMLNNKGFTLIELLVAMTIIAILSVIGVTTYLGVQSKARDAQRMDDAKKIITTLEQYKSGAGTYPSSCNNDWCFSNATPPWITNIDLSNFKDDAVPVDPTNERSCTATSCSSDTVYKYKSNTTGSDYCLEIPQENDVSGNPYYKNYDDTTKTWKLRFGPKGANAGVCHW